MAVVAGSVQELYRGREGSLSEQGEHSVTRTFWVEVDDPLDDHSVPIVATGIQRGDQHPNFNVIPAYALEVRAEHPQDDPYYWVVTWTYKSISPELIDNPQGPLFDPPKISWSSQTYRRTAERDINGDAIQNFALMPYDPPVEKDESQWVVRWSRNYSIVPQTVLSYENAVNSDPFSIDGVAIAVRQAKIQGLRIGEYETRDDIPFRVVSLELHLRTDGWREVRLNAGWEEFQTAGDPAGGHQRILIGKNVEPNHVWPLNSQGRAIFDFSSLNPDQPTYSEYQLYDELPFSAWGFS